MITFFVECRIIMFVVIYCAQILCIVVTVLFSCLFLGHFFFLVIVVVVFFIVVYCVFHIDFWVSLGLFVRYHNSLQNVLL